MTALLFALTFGALALSGALVFYILRLTRQERDRSAARAAALADAINDPASGPGMDLGRDPWRVERTADVPSQGPTFGADREVAAPRGWALAPIGGLLVVGLALSGIYAWSRSAGSAGASDVVAPLELLSLDHDRRGDTLLVSGVVRNPASGRTLGALTAVAFTFDRKGTLLTTGRAALDYPRLSAGDESPFSIAMPGASAASRYRVSFRTDAGVLSHVDRRERPAVAVPARVEVRR